MSPKKKSPKFISLKPSGISSDFDVEIHEGQPIVTVEEKEQSIAISYVFAGFTVSEEDIEIDGEIIPFKEVGVSGAGYLSESGKPLLPSFGRFVQIPYGCNFEVKTHFSKPLKLEDFIIIPAQEDATDGPEKSIFEYDKKSYSGQKEYPKNIVEVSGPFDIDGYNVLSIHIRPLRFNAEKKLLFGISNINVDIKLIPQEEKDQLDVNKSGTSDPNSNLKGFGNLILNPSRNIGERITKIPGRIPPLKLKRRGPEFIIIYGDNQKKAAEKLSSWKNYRGIITETVSISTVGNTVNKLKKFIRNKRSSFLSRLRYILLFGDVTNIVTEQNANATTDFYFFTKSDPSNNTDCIIPWISGGRIPVSDQQEALDIVNQIINYEKNPPADREYYRRMTFAAFFQDNAPQDNKADRAYMKTMEGIREHMIALGFDIDRAYVSNNPNPAKYKDGVALSQSVKDAVVDSNTATDILIGNSSEGQLLIGHRDHGNTDGWHEPPFHNYHLSSITGQIPSIFFSINCLTGQFDANPVDSFAEAILKFKGGAPSLIAATELSGTWRNDSLMKALFDAMWPGVIPAFPGGNASYAIQNNRLGDILNYAKAYLLVAHGTNSGVKNHFEIYHCIGDPTIQLWAEEPLNNKLKAKIWRQKLYIYTGCPINAAITIWHKGRLLKRFTPSSTRISIALRDLKLISSPLPTGSYRRHTLSVCFSAPGYRYRQVNIKY